MKAKINTAFLFWAFALLRLLLFGHDSWAQKSVSSSLSKKEIRIGEQTLLTLTATAPAASKIVFPNLKDSVAPSIEIVSAGKPDTQWVDNGKTIALKRAYTLTAFDSGFFPLPPFRFTIDGDTGFETSADLLTVLTVPVDTSAAFKAIKQPLDAPWTLAEIYLELTLAAGILLLAILLFYWWRKRKKITPVEIEKVEPKIPAHVIALEALNELKEQQLWQKGNIKLYHVKLSEIARTYLQNRFTFHALEKTTDEIAFSLSSINAGVSEKQALIEALRISDLVKFAKANPMAGDHEFCWTTIAEFVKKTMEVFPQKNEKEVKNE